MVKKNRIRNVIREQLHQTVQENESWQVETAAQPFHNFHLKRLIIERALCLMLPSEPCLSASTIHSCLNAHYCNRLFVFQTLLLEDGSPLQSTSHTFSLK